MDEPGHLFADAVDIAASARRAAAHMVKMRACHYARRPLALEALHPGLSSAPPAVLIAIAAYLVEREARSRRRGFGFGGEVGLINARAALVLGRVLRRNRTKRTIDLPKRQIAPKSPPQEP